MSTRDLLRRNDERFFALASELDAQQWAAPSLCDAWSNHEVLAHLVVGYRTRPGEFVREMVRHNASFDRANTAMACALAARCRPADLLDEFRRLVHRPRGLGRTFPPRLLLGDHVTHELDIVIALGLVAAIPPDAAAAVLNTQVAVPNPFVPAFGNSRGLRLRATDIDWAHGTTGLTVEGDAVDLISVLGNRPRMLNRLSGSGVSLLASRVSPAPSHKAG